MARVNIDESWFEYLSPEFDSYYMKNLSIFIFGCGFDHAHYVKNLNIWPDCTVLFKFILLLR